MNTCTSLCASLTSSNSVKNIWNRLRPLDFSFVSNTVTSTLIDETSLATLQGKKDKELDVARTALTYEDAWVKLNSIRRIETDYIAGSSKAKSNVPSSSTTSLDEHASINYNYSLEGCFTNAFPMDVKLTSIDEENHTLSYEILNPRFASIPNSVAISLSKNPHMGTFALFAHVNLPTTFTVSVKETNEDDKSGAIITWKTELSSESSTDPDESHLDATFATKWCEFLTQKLDQTIQSGVNVGDVDDVSGSASDSKITYPLSQRRGVAEDFFGTRVVDSFRWLEDPDSIQTQRWVREQNTLTSSILSQCDTREKIAKRLPDMYSYERYSAPFKRGSNYYYSRNDGLQNQSVYYQTTDIKQPGRVFLDPTTLDKDGLASISILSFSPSGKYVAIGIQRRGSDWTEVIVRDCETLEDLGGSDKIDQLFWLKFTSISWTKDEQGFFYSRYPKPASLEAAAAATAAVDGEKSEKSEKSAGTETDSTHLQSLCYHYIGTKQDEDVIVYNTPDAPTTFISGSVSDDGKYLLLTLNDSCDNVNKLYVSRLQSANNLPSSSSSSTTVVPRLDYSTLQYARVVDNLDACYDYVTSAGVGTLFDNTMESENAQDVGIFITNLDAPKSRIIALDLARATDNNITTNIFHTNQDKRVDTCREEDIVVISKDDTEKLQKQLARAPVFKELLPENEDGGVLSNAISVGGMIVVMHNVKVVDVVNVYSVFYEGSMGTGPMSGGLGTTGTGSALGSAMESRHNQHKEEMVSLMPMSCNLDLIPSNSTLSINGKPNSTELFVQATSMIYPGASFVIDLIGEQQVFKQSAPKGFNSDDFISEQKFYTSKDGTQIPMFISYHKDIDIRSGDNPVYLYGYGGFNISLGPSFSVNRWLWMNHFRGITVVANLRGGGEFGEEWHEQGVGLKKQNVFDDFHAAAEYLVAEKYTQHSKIAIHGGSNGGLLVAACANQRPELYGAAVAAVGVLDMLRFHKFTVGFAWCSDYGCADESKEHFENLYRISPYHSVPIPVEANVQKCILPAILNEPQNAKEFPKPPLKYLPPIMVTTSDHDDRVAPLHSLKYVAQAQTRVGHISKHATIESPIIARVEEKAGHGAGKPLSKQMEEHADVFGFFAKYTNAEWRD